MRGSATSLKLRRLAAGGAALGWFFGLYALPIAHNLDHRSDHTHGPPESPRNHHGHGHGEHEYAHEHPHPHERSDSESVPIDSEHGTRSVLHFAAAALDIDGSPAPEAGPPVFVPFVGSPRSPYTFPKRLVLVRGPPLVS